MNKRLYFVLFISLVLILNANPARSLAQARIDEPTPAVDGDGLDEGAEVDPAEGDDAFAAGKKKKKNKKKGGGTAAPLVNSPLTYDAVSDRLARIKPPAPALGPAGSIVTDPTFGSRILRVTDARSQSDMPNRAYNTPSSSEQNAWNATSTMFYIEDRGGRILFYDFDASSMRATRTADKGKPGSALTFFSSQMRPSPTFSYNDSNIIYGVGGKNGRTIRQYEFDSNKFTDLLDLDTTVAGLSGTTGDPSVSDNERICTYYGGSLQDQHFLVVVFDKGTGQQWVLNTLTSTVNGQAVSGSLGFRLHNARIDRSGRFVVMTQASTGKVIVWDVANNSVADVTATASGHRAAGYARLINQSGDDGAQYQVRSLERSSLNSPSPLIRPRLTPVNWGISTHGSWNNAMPDVQVPIIQSQYRTTAVTDKSPWRAWDDEIIAIRTDGVESTVWRFAHHRSDYLRYRQFYDTPRVNVSTNGRYALFTSNWEGTLGNQPNSSLPRQDVFLVELGGNSPDNTPAPFTISEVSVAPSLPSGAIVKWSTNREADGQIEYGLSPEDSAVVVPHYTSLMLNHSFYLGGLESGRTYFIKLKSKDAQGNVAESARLTFTMPFGQDTIAPKISAVTLASLSATSATITWTTDEAADSQVEYGTTVGFGSTAASAGSATNHSVTISSLAAGGVYYYRVKSKDASGNLSVSGGFTFTTPAVSGAGPVVGMASSVVWTNLVSCVATPTELKKTRGHDGAVDAGAVSQQSIPAGSSGYVEFVAAERNKIRFIGLTSDPNAGSRGADWKSIDFAMKLSNNGVIAIYENGVWRAQTAYTTGDKLRVAVEAGVVRYYRNGSLIYQSAQPPAFPMMVDTSILNMNGTISNAVFWSSNGR